MTVTRGYCLHSKVMGQAGAVGIKRVNCKLKVSLLKEKIAKLVNHPEALWAGGEEYVDDELM